MTGSNLGPRDLSVKTQWRPKQAARAPQSLCACQYLAERPTWAHPGQQSQLCQARSTYFFSETQ